MKHLLALALLVAICPLFSACTTTGPSASINLEIAYQGSGDVRYEPLEGILVGHSTGLSTVGVRDAMTGAMIPVATLSGNKRRVLNRKLHFDEQFELDAPIPLWCKPLFPEAVLDPETGRYKALLPGGEVLWIAGPSNPGPGDTVPAS